MHGTCPPRLPGLCLPPSHFLRLTCPLHKEGCAQHSLARYCPRCSAQTGGIELAAASRDGATGSGRLTGSSSRPWLASTAAAFLAVAGLSAGSTSVDSGPAHGSCAAEGAAAPAVDDASNVTAETADPSARHAARHEAWPPQGATAASTAAVPWRELKVRYPTE
jgi:hypothetical protein